MTIGSVLVQPQRIRRLIGLEADKALVNDIASLMTRLMVDQAQGGELLKVMQQAIDSVSDRVRQQTTGGLSRAVQRLQVLLKPGLDFVLALQPPDSATAGLVLIQQLLTRFTALVESLTAEGLRQQTTLVLDIVQNDLGITNTFLQEQIWRLVDDLIAQLEAVPPGLDPQAQDNRLNTASILRRVKRRLQSQFTLPELNAESLAQRLIDLLRDSSLKATLSKIACVTTGLSEAIAAGTALTQLVPFASPPINERLNERLNFSINRSSPQPLLADTLSIRGAIDRDLSFSDPPVRTLKYAWYASWLLGSKDRTDGTILAALPLPWMPDAYADVWLENGQVIKANLFGGGGEPLKDPRTDAPYPGSLGDWTEIPIFTRREPPYYLFNRISKDTIEKWAYHTGWAADALKMTLNLTSIEEGDWLSNLLNAIYYAGQGIFKLAGQKPLNWWLPVEAFPDARVPWWLLSRMPLATGLGSLQGMHTKASFGNAFSFWFTLVLADGGEQYILNLFVETLRNALLSILTLVNNEGPFSAPSGIDTRPANLRESGGVVDLVGLLLGLVLPGPPKDKYGYPFQNAEVVLLWNLLISTGFSILKTVVGTAVAAAIARSIDWKEFGIKLITSEISSLLGFYPALYLAAEGDTDKGKYNPAGANYTGYPPPATSPYSLPYPAGVSYQCSQGNQGMWSHNNLTASTQIYAFDFAMEQADVILASRPGTVVSYSDSTPDDEVAGGAWNNIVIRHDLEEDAAGNLTPLGAPLADHDVGPGGNPTVTFGVYGHGRQNSITQVFGDRGIGPAAIVGSQVRKGQPIMLAGDTGNSFYNHLHMHVNSESLPRPTGTATAPLANAAKGTTAIPFVFREVKGKLEINRFTGGIDGVPASLNYYTSENQQVT